jgi:diguanylate cyclase (GGDEF)-like protein
MALRGQLTQVKAVADDNANWDDAAIALYKRGGDQDFGWRTWGAVSDNENVYDTLFTINERGDVQFRYEDGKVSNADFKQRFGSGLQTLIRQAKQDGKITGGIVSVDGLPRVVGVAKVTPTTASLARQVDQFAPIFLVVARRVSPTKLAMIGDELQLENLALTKEKLPSSVELKDPNGLTIGRLGWTPGNPGYKAFWRAWPTISLALVLRLAALILLLTYCLRFYRQLRRNALVDALSDLPNRLALETELARNLKRGEHAALAFLDLDGFKAINDTYGHSVGDELIKECSKLASELASDCTMVARLGGDEFAVLACGINAEERLSEFAEVLLHRLGQPFHLGSRTMMIGVSIGMSARAKGADDVTELMRRADIAMYASKRTGKMRVTKFDVEIDQRQAEAHDIDRRMRVALDEGHFQVFYQPLIGARCSRVVSLEALLRWNDPDGAIVGPDQFIPIAEETGLIDRIGLLVLDRACRDGLAWPGLQLAINVSAAQLRNPDFPARLAEILRETGFPAHRLELEITETYVVQQPEIANRVLAEIQQLGVKIALDDFGTGYASIGFLRQFNFDTLKIDRSLVVDAISDDGARAMVHASIVVARALGMAVVAEGIENEAQAHFMRVAGCDHLQGWLYSPAVAAHEVASLVNSIANATQAELDLPVAVARAI